MAVGATKKKTGGIHHGVWGWRVGGTGVRVVYAGTKVSGSRS